MKKGFLNTSSLTWSYCANWQKSDLNLQTLDASLTVFDTNTFLCTKKYWGLVPSPFYSLAKWSTWKALYMLKLYVWVVCCHGSRPVWTRETGFSSSQRQCLHPGLVYSGSYSYLVKDGCSQLQSPPQRVTHISQKSASESCRNPLWSCSQRRMRNKWEGEICYDSGSNRGPDYCHRNSSFVSASLEGCRRRWKMVALTADTVL